MLLFCRQSFYFSSKTIQKADFEKMYNNYKSIEKNLWIYKSGKEFVVQPAYEFLTGNFFGQTVSFRSVIVENGEVLEFRGHFRSNIFFKIFAVLSLLIILFQVDFILENLLSWVAMLLIIFGIEIYLQFIKKSLIKKINNLFL